MKLKRNLSTPEGREFWATARAAAAVAKSRRDIKRLEAENLGLQTEQEGMMARIDELEKAAAAALLAANPKREAWRCEAFAELSRVVDKSCVDFENTSYRLRQMMLCIGKLPDLDWSDAE